MGVLRKVTKATKNTSANRLVNRSEKALIDIIKKTWHKLNLVSGWEIRMYGDKKDIANIKDKVETLYIVNDDTDLPDWDLLDSYYVAYGKPTVTFKDFTSKDTTGDFGSLMDEL